MAHAASRDDLDALKDGASTLLQAGNRIAALSLLWSAVAIDPTDLSAHRRLAATLATGGDLDGAADEFARYVEFVVPLGDVGRAASELAYGVSMIGGHPALHRAADKIAEAVRALVPPSTGALARTAPLAAIAAAVEPVRAPAAPEARVTVAAPRPAPRLLPKVPFRVCVHESGGQQWMRLEGGHRGLVPASVRMLDAAENEIDGSPCMPLPIVGAHGSSGLVTQPVVYAVLGVHDANMLTGRGPSRFQGYTFQARVNADWLAIELFETKCRLAVPSADARPRSSAAI